MARGSFTYNWNEQHVENGRLHRPDERRSRAGRGRRQPADGLHRPDLRRQRGRGLPFDGQRRQGERVPLLEVAVLPERHVPASAQLQRRRTPLRARGLSDQLVPARHRDRTRGDAGRGSIRSRRPAVRRRDEPRPPDRESRSDHSSTANVTVSADCFNVTNEDTVLQRFNRLEPDESARSATRTTSRRFRARASGALASGSRSKAFSLPFRPPGIRFPAAFFILGMGDLPHR